MNKPLIIKIGGSLYPHAREIISTILDENRTTLIIPGGGGFADAVRATQVEGTAAHWMAIAGMEQYGWYLSSFGIETTDIPKFGEEPRVFLPYQFLRLHDTLPHSWDVTSDTISAFVAHQLSADLLILKSLDQIRAMEKPLDRINAPVKTNDLDPCFIPFILENSISGLIINGTIPERIAQALRDTPVIGTRFGIII
jgi:hypothetical protein